MFREGDRIKRRDNRPFRDGRRVVAIKRIDEHGVLHLDNGTYAQSAHMYERLETPEDRIKRRLMEWI